MGSESTVLGYVTASAHLADASASRSRPLPLLPLNVPQAPAPTPRQRTPSLGNATKAYPSIPVNTRHARDALFGTTHADSTLLSIGELEAVPYVPYPVLFRSPPRTYRTCQHIYSPSPGLGQAMAGIETTDSSFPPFCFRMSATSRLKCHARYKLAAVPLETRGPNTDCIATTRLVLILGRRSVFVYFILSNSRGDSPSAFQCRICSDMKASPCVRAVTVLQ